MTTGATERHPIPGDLGVLVDLTGLVRSAGGAGMPAGVSVRVLDETGGGVRCHKQRAADAAVAAVVRAGYRLVTVGSCGNFGWAVARAAHAAGVHALVVVPVGFTADVSRIARAGARVIRSGATYEEAVAASHQVAARCADVADLNVDGPYAEFVEAAHRRIADAVAGGAGVPPAGLWIPLGNGTTLGAVAAAVFDLGWRSRVFGATSLGNNSVLASWPGVVHRPLDSARIRPTPVSEPLVNVDALHGQQALDALHATCGLAVGVDDAALINAARLLRSAGLRVSPAGAAGFAGLLAAARTGLDAGLHVALLTG